MTKLGGSRWPSKPRPGERCDAHVGTSVDNCGKPIVIGCKELATETVKMRTIGFEMYLCDKHAETFGSSGQVVRNPRRKAGKTQ